MSKFVEYVIAKPGIGSAAYFVASKKDAQGWIAGFFPACMAPDPDDTDEMIFDLANPERTFTGTTRDEAEQKIRDWVEASQRIIERRERRAKP